MTKYCPIIEDLLPLYEEGLLQEETKLWVEDHIKNCEQCADLVELSEMPLKKESLPNPVDHEKMMSKITFKLSIYQLILVGISFFLAIRTVILQESFGYILAYTILGLITYLFYKNVYVVILISFVPVFIWHLVEVVPHISYNAAQFSQSIWRSWFDALLGAGIGAGIHFVFAVIGMVIGILILKIRESEETS